VSDRWVLKRSLTGATLHTEAPVNVTDAPSRAINGAGSMRFTLSAAFASRTSDLDGRPLVAEWDTRIYQVDENGRVLWGGIIISSDDSSTEWQLEAQTDSTVLFGTPYLGPALTLAEVDPADIVRRLVTYMQAQPDSNWRIAVAGSTSARTGTYSTQQAEDAAKRYTAAVKAYDAAVAERKRLAAIVAASRKQYSVLVQESQADNAELAAAKKAKPKNQARINAAQAAVNDVTARKAAKNASIAAQQDAVDEQARVVTARRSAKGAAYDVKVAANRQKKDDGGAFELSWWEATDCGQILQDLAEDTPFDYTDEWKMTGDAITSTIRIFHPRAGRERSDVAFEQGINVVEVIEARVDGDNYASEVVGIGAGEGAGSIRRSTAKRTGRPRRTKVVTDKDIKWAGQMDRRINKVLAGSLNVIEVQKLRVRGTRSIKLGSWSLGDDVPVRVTLRGHGDIDLVHRIVEQQQVSDTDMVLTLKRSDSFIYGG